jgi:phage shock protein A
MDSLINRLTAMVRAWVSHLLDNAEDPAVTLDYSYERQRELLQNVRGGVADVVTAKKRVQLQTTKIEESVVKLEGQARQALAAGREDLARLALQRKAMAQQQLQGLDRQADELEQQQARIAQSEQRLSAKVEAFRTEKEVIKAEYTAAEAQVRIGEAATGLGEEMADTGRAIERVRDRTEQLQARAGAIDELVESGALEDLTGSSDHLDRQLEHTELETQVESDLNRLKGELPPSQEQPQLTQRTAQ